MNCYFDDCLHTFFFLPVSDFLAPRPWYINHICHWIFLSYILGHFVHPVLAQPVFSVADVLDVGVDRVGKGDLDGPLVVGQVKLIAEVSIKLRWTIRYHGIVRCVSALGESHSSAKRKSGNGQPKPSQFFHIHGQLFAFDILELPYRRGYDEIELFCIFGQRREDKGETKLLVGPGYIG